jgi:hypothetical protein
MGREVSITKGNVYVMSSDNDIPDADAGRPAFSRVVS